MFCILVGFLRILHLQSLLGKQAVRWPVQMRLLEGHAKTQK